MRTIKSLLVLAVLSLPATLTAANATVLGWNNLGMHCMDSDYSVFSILPPYNTIEAQLIVGGKLVTNGAGYSVTYQAVADPSGSFNSTAMGKGNFYQYSGALYGATPPAEGGLLSWSMPGLSNTPQTMLFEVTNVPAPIAAARVNWFRAEGIPISPYDDALNKNPYPLMRIIARNGANQPIATNDVVLPVSDEMDCRLCHASGTEVDAQPEAGWVWDGLPERDFRLNILRLHDERQFASRQAVYSAALAANHFNPAGLYRSVTVDNHPVLCAKCHASEALGAPSFPTVPPLTASIHSRHARVMDPVSGTTLNNSANRAACYRCHPGSTTRCLRGAMGGAVAADGAMEMQCQSCHGNMSQVGAADRVGWFMEPNCQSCHTGTATHNNGQIRYTTVFTNASGGVREAVDQTFATQADTPAPGISLFRFSSGHGGLQCEACHGSTHAEFPATHRNDNLRNLALQGHAGVMVECTACHANMPNTVTGGPHGMHPISSDWITGHHDAIHNEADRQACRVCHGLDYRGTVLSRAQAKRSFNVNLDNGSLTLNLFRGASVGCYTCHNGPNTSALNTNLPPSVSNVTTNTTNDQAVSVALPVSGAGAILSLLSQPANGTVGLSNAVATYFPEPGFVGEVSFTYAAYDGAKNSSLATGTVAVAQGPYSIGAQALVLPDYPAAWAGPFSVVPIVTNHAAPVIVEWDFGDGSPHAAGKHQAHTYSLPGNYNWKVTCTVAAATVTRSGSIQVTAPILLTQSQAGGNLILSWPLSRADAVLETTPELGPSAQWMWVSNTVSGPDTISAVVPLSGQQFFRVRRPW